MYADFWYQVSHMSKFFIAFLFLFLFLPRIIIGKIDEEKADNLVANYIRTVFFVIVVGYILSFLKLFEFITLFVIILALLYRKILSEAKYMGRQTHESTGLWILRFLDKQINVLKVVTGKIINIKNIFVRPTDYFNINIDKIVYAILTFTVLLLSAYIRFYDAMNHAAFPLSDSYITLDWLKGVERRQLFYEPGGGVYPRGLSIFMATIHKFSFMDELFVLKYTGPLNGLLIVVSILFVVYKLTRNKYAALTVSALYGIGAGVLGSDIERQAATNSQEFALVFLLPTIYFTYKYLRERRKRDFLTVISGLSVIGLAHTYVYLFGVIAVSINIFILFVKGPVKNFKHYMKFIVGGIFSAIVSIIPFAVGLLQGIGLHGSSVEFLTDTGNIVLKKLSNTDYLSITAFVIFVICLLVMMKKKTTEAFSLVPVFLFCICVFFIYYAGGYITKSTLIDTRTREIWALCSALTIGLGFGLLMAWIEKWKAGKVCSLGTSIICLVLILSLVGAKPLEPYKMEWDSGVEQYLKIAKHYQPKSWTMVAEQIQYAMVTGTGFIDMKADFVKKISAENAYSDSWNDIGEHIFIYQQKNIFKVKESNSIYSVEEPKYLQMKTDEEAMNKWLETFKDCGGSYDVFYEDENIRFIYIHNKVYEDKDKEKLWGE